MKDKEFKRKENLEKAYKELHGIKPKVYKKILSRNGYSIKIEMNKKEAILTEFMKDGLTDHVVLECGGNVYSMNSMYEAEKKANELLGSKDG